MKEQYEQLLHEKEILVNQLDNYERDTQTIDQLRENVVFLTTQLDETKHLWQQFDVLKNLVPFSNKISLNEIIQDIILYINNLTKEIDRFQQNEQLLNQQILSLQNECQTFKQQFNELEKQSSYQENTKQTRRTPIQEVC
jgi:phage shock protein A